MFCLFENISNDKMINIQITEQIWSGKRDLNPQPLRWQRNTLPLSYFRFFFIYIFAFVFDL